MMVTGPHFTSGREKLVVEPLATAEAAPTPRVLVDAEGEERNDAHLQWLDD